jgi:hypothetical protein
MKVFIERHQLGSKVWYYVSEGAGLRPLSIPLSTREQAEDFIRTMVGNISYTYIGNKNNPLKILKNPPKKK